MNKGRNRDKNGRFSKYKNITQALEAVHDKDMSGDKRTRRSDEEHDLSGAGSPSTSPLRKKSLAEETAAWRFSPNGSRDFYPQYMLKADSLTKDSSPGIKSNKPWAHNPQAHNCYSSHGKLNNPTSVHRGNTVSTEGKRDLSHDHGQSESLSTDSIVDVDFISSSKEDSSTSGSGDMAKASMAGATGYNPINNSDNQVTQLLPRAPMEQDNVIILSNSKGIPINTVDLEGVMSRVMSQVMGKLDSMSTDLKQVPVIKAATAKLDREMIQVRQDCHGIKESVNDLKKREESYTSKQEALEREVRAIKSDLLSRPGDKGKDSALNPPVTEHDFLLKEAAARKINLIIEGITEPEQDEGVVTAVTQIKTFFTETLHLPKFEIASAFRLGKTRQEATRPRPIKVQFLQPHEREMVWKAKAVLARIKDTTFSIKEDLPPKLRAQMSSLIRVSQIARRYPNLYKNVWINDFQIYINGTAYSAEQLESLPSKLRPSVSSTPGNIYVVVFYGRDSKFSNHFQCNFTWDNKDFSSIEQYLAYRRATIAGNRDLANQVMGSRDPADAKRIMNILRSASTEPKWVDQRKDILFSGLMAKFSQNEYLMRYLLESGTRKLGEASLDKTWGIGMSLRDKLVLDSTKWVGENLLGVTLMEVRDELKAWTHQDAEPAREVQDNPTSS